MIFNEFLLLTRNLKPVGEKEQNQWRCDCPACGDTKRHLYVSYDNKKILLHCKKGCSLENIMQAFDLKPKDMYFTQHKENRWVLLRTHEYISKDGNKLAVKTIYKKNDGSKTATWQRYEGNTLVKGLNGLKMPLYHVYNLDKTKPVFIVEGEKDVETLERLGYVATTSPNGAGSHWRKDFNSTFKDFNVVIIADNDEIGLKYATEIANNLINIAKSIKLVPSEKLYNKLQPKGDISDILELIGTQQVTQLLEDVLNNNIYLYTSKPTAKDDIPEWQQSLKKTNTNKILPTLHNIVEILRNDENYSHKIGYNELTNLRAFNHDDWTDFHESSLKLYLEEKYEVIASAENINHACNIIENENKYHPIKDYIKAIKWDGIPRIETVFIDFLGAKNNPYTKKVALITFLGAIARIENAGCKFDTCTVFIGKQGIGKSKFIRAIAIKPEWFTDGISTFDGKEFYESIMGKWIIELSEGTAFQKSTKERTKQIISVQEDFYRKPYRRNPVRLKRQCVFLGTTNSYNFLKDETGDRRYYPIDVDIKHATMNIDKDLTLEYINQLWAEALTRYKNGEEIYITDKTILNIAEQEQRNHFDDNPLQLDIYNFLEILIPQPQEWYIMSLENRRKYINAILNGEDTQKLMGLIGTYKRNRISVREIVCEYFNYDLNQLIERKLSIDIGKSLVALGWTKGEKSEWIKSYGLAKVYYRN